MEILFYQDVSVFQPRALPVLKRQCAVNSLKLGLLAYYCQPGNTAHEHVFALGVKHERVVAVFIQARYLYFFAEEACCAEAVQHASEAFLARQIKIPAVMGPGDLALRFAEAWRQRTQTDFQLTERDYLYELRQLEKAPSSQGKLRRAVLEDMPVLRPLFRAYYREDLGMTPTEQELERSIIEQLAENEIYLWAEAGPKSMVTAMLPFDSGVELANVFTPPEHRKKGYATACLTAVCQDLLQRYASIVLFVGQHNSAAQALYAKLGFQVVDEMNTYTFA
jgi:uncharacterized protein